jgi:hypothetical protein
MLLVLTLAFILHVIDLKCSMSEICGYDFEKIFLHIIAVALISVRIFQVFFVLLNGILIKMLASMLQN